MRAQIGGWVLAAALAIASSGCARPLPNGEAARAFATVPAHNGAALKVASPSFQAGGDMPESTTQYGANRFPGLSWSGAPAGVRAYLLILQDVNAEPKGAPLVHCVLINIPPGVTDLPPGMTTPPAPAYYGVNYANDSPPYAGPRPPLGPKHHYHFQMFALDAPLSLPPGADYAGLTTAMTGHVLASGEVVGQFGAPN